MTKIPFNKPYRCDICKQTFADGFEAGSHVGAAHHVSPEVSMMLVTKRKKGRWSR